MKDINDILPKIPNMRWGALMNKAPTNDKVKEMNKIVKIKKYMSSKVFFLLFDLFFTLVTLLPFNLAFPLIFDLFFLFGAILPFNLLLSFFKKYNSLNS